VEAVAAWQRSCDRARRTAFESWFNREDVHDVAFPALKARQRATPAGEPMALQDVIRIAHVCGRTDAHRTLIGWLAGRVSDADARVGLPDVDDFLTAQAVTTPAEAIAVIRERRVPWEFLPSAVMKDAGVWAELTQPGHPSKVADQRRHADGSGRTAKRRVASWPD
jgi:60 kDa SS-A/Ro ribonucleoprotein